MVYIFDVYASTLLKGVLLVLFCNLDCKIFQAFHSQKDRDGPWSRPEHTFDLQSLRDQPAFDSGTFWLYLKRFFLTEGKKIEMSGILGEIF